MNELGPFTFWELFVLIIVLSAVIGGGSVLVAHRWLRTRVKDGHNDVLVPLYATAAVIYAVLLAFIVIAVWEQFSAARETVSSEASTLTTMYRETEAMPGAERAAMRGLIRKYTETVIHDEWNVQAGGGQSPAAREAIVQMYRVIGSQPPRQATPTDVQFATDLANMASDRTKRLLATQDQLPWILWLGLIAGGIVVVVLGAVLYMEDVRLHAATSAWVGALIGLLLFGVVVLDRPFEGMFQIKPDAFEHAIAVYDSVDQTPV